MNVQVTVKNLDGIETNNIDDVKNKNDFYYKDSFDAYNHILVEKDAVKIKRVSKEHSTFVCLNSDSGYINIASKEGEFRIDLKVVAFNIKDDIITIAYKLAEDTKEITIKYLGV